jgi:hypothetical protein
MQSAGYQSNLPVPGRVREGPESVRSSRCRQNRRRSAIHPIEPVPVGTANGRCGASRPVPAVPAECRLCDQKGDLRWDGRQRGRCADPGRSRTTIEPIGSTPEADISRLPGLAERETKAGHHQLAMLGLSQVAVRMHHCCGRVEAAQPGDDFSRLLKPPHMGIAHGKHAIDNRGGLLLDREQH